MSDVNSDAWKKLNGVVIVVPQKYVDALLILHDKFESTGVRWIVDGDLAERLRVINVEPESIEIICSREDAMKIFQIFHDFNPKPIVFETQQLLRNAVIEGKEYSVYTRCYFFNFIIIGVNVKVQGDLQYKVGEWEWGEILNFEPEYVNIVGKEIPVTPLNVKSELYRCLGWSDRFEKLESLRLRLSPPRFKQS